METMSEEARREAFGENIFRQGDDHHYWDYAQWLAMMLEQALEHIEGLFGAETAAAPLRQLVQVVADQSYPSAKTWRDVMEDTLAAGTCLPIAQRLHDGLLYGLYGLTAEDVPPEKRESWVSGLVDEINAFASRSDVVALGGGDNAILNIAGLVRSRYALDTGVGEVDTHSMAILGDITEGRVRNLMSGESSPLERGTGGGIVALSALSWLMKKKGFLRSIWRDAGTDLEAGSDASTPAPDPRRVIFVPVARDGSMFTPDLKRNGTYQIGAKGEEENLASFEEALARLNAMPVPRWRRPNEKAIWGIVSGVSWQRVEKKLEGDRS